MLTIDVRGTTGVGKSHIARLIQQTLLTHGINATVETDDSEVAVRQITERVRMGHLPYGIKKRTVVITETHVRTDSPATEA